MKASYFFAASAVAAAAAFLPGSAASAQTVVNFDQSTNPSTYAAQGLVLNGFSVGGNTFGGAVIVPSEPNYAGPNDSAATISFVDSLGRATTSNGFGLTTVGLNSGNGYYDGATLTFLGVNGDVLGSQTFAPVGPSEGRSPFEYTNSFANIATIQFTLTQNPRGPGLFAIDNVTFTPNAVAGAVPEPATWAMMLVGFGMIGFGMRYRRKSTKVSFA